MAEAAGGPGEARPERVREKYEWSNIWWDCADDASLRRVLLIGDSISAGYGATVIERLAGQVHVDRLSTSRNLIDPVLLTETRMMLGDARYSAVHFNNGLHGWHLDLQQYEDGLRAYVETLRAGAPGAPLVWASSTPVTVAHDAATLEGEHNAVVLERNRVAAGAMQACALVTNDLYALCVGRPEWKTADGYHFNAQGQRAQGEAVAAALRHALEVLP